MIANRNLESIAALSPNPRTQKLRIELDYKVDLVDSKMESVSSHLDCHASSSSLQDWDSFSRGDTTTCTEALTLASSCNFDSSFASRTDTDNDDVTKKSVSFSMDDKGEVVAQEFPAPQIVLSKQEIGSLWWRPCEFKAFKRYSKRMAQSAQKSPYLEKFKAFYEKCEGLTIKKTDIPMFINICNTPARGLEVPIFDPILVDRKLTVDGILKVQTKVLTSVDSKDKVKVLSATSKFLTKHARAMAYAIGQGDAVIAKAIHKEEPVLKWSEDPAEKRLSI